MILAKKFRGLFRLLFGGGEFPAPPKKNQAWTNPCFTSHHFRRKRKDQM